MILAVSRNPLISTTRHVWVLLDRSWDQVRTKLEPSRVQITGEVGRVCEATADAVKHNETEPLPGLRIGCSQ